MRKKNESTIKQNFIRVTRSSVKKRNENSQFSEKNINYFSDLLERHRKSLFQAEFDVSNSDYTIKEHCTELRRQVQLSKETKILKIEQLSDQFIEQIDDYEKQLIDKSNHENISSNAKIIRNENLEWYNEPNEYNIDSELIDNLRNSFSKFISKETEINNNIFENKKLVYMDSDEKHPLGCLTFNQVKTIKLKEHFKKAFFELNFDLNKSTLIFFSVLSNGDFLACINTYEDVQVLMIFDLKTNTLKKMLQMKTRFPSLESYGTRICLTHLTDKNTLTYSILDENLKTLSSGTLKKYLKVIGANESFLFCLAPPMCKKKLKNTQKNGSVYLYDWSFNLIKIIGQTSNKSKPFYFLPFQINRFTGSNFEYFAGRYFFYDQFTHVFSVVCEKSGALIWKISAEKFLIGNNYNVYILKSEPLATKTEVKIFSFNGELIKQFMVNRWYEYFLDENNKLCAFEYKTSKLIYHHDINQNYSF